MANLLYVTCNLKPMHRSRSLSVGYEFLEEYLRWNPRDEVHVLDLYRDNIQRIDEDVLNAWEKLSRGEGCASLGAEEKRKISRIWRLADQFVACDKYVFVTPMWNLGFPAEFKMYIDAICVVDRTYRLTERGAEGLLAGEWKKSLHIHAEPFRYGSEKDLGAPFLRSVLNFLGVIDQETVLLNGGDDPQRDPRPDSHDAARKRLLDLALRF